MADLWEPLAEDILGSLRESVRDLVDTERDDVKEALAEIAKEAARQTWLLVRGDDAEKAQAPANLRSLKAQAIIVAADVVVNSTREARAEFFRVIETVGIFLLRNAPKLIAAI